MFKFFVVEVFQPQMVLFTCLAVFRLFPGTAWQGVNRPWECQLAYCRMSISHLFWRRENAGHNLMHTSFYGHFSYSHPRVAGRVQSGTGGSFLEGHFTNSRLLVGCILFKTVAFQFNEVAVELVFIQS